MSTPALNAPQGTIADLIAPGLVTPEVLALVDERLSSEQVALLIVEALNPHAELAVSDQAKLAGVNRSTLNRRK